MATRNLSAEQVAALMMETDEESDDPDMDISDTDSLDLDTNWSSEEGDTMISSDSYVSSDDGVQPATHDNDQHNDDHLFKIRTVLDHFNDVMPAIYYPRKDLSIDESMVLWRGRLLFRQYIKNKRHKYGIKLYELCKHRGTVLKIQVYSSVHLTDDNGYGQAAATVLDHLDGYLDKGHVVYTYNYYNSVSLVKMTNRSTYLCGTLRFDRKENPKDLIKQKLKKGDHVWKWSESVVVCKWKDKREVLTISNMHRIEMVDVRNWNDKLSRKPNTVRDYNGMAGVDRSDQMLSYYSALRKIIRWYKKIVLHILEVFLLNAHILYNANKREQMKLLKFRDLVTIHLLGDVYDKLRDHGPAHSQAPVNETFHYLAPLPPTEKKE
ncbi:piggyBac transposable element-derived protein 4-like [Gigantopelta aegis]|uniref:piggyBac transposable element-derived protein 4-like n=1 Tax=Gigantopelta aegis TaxID=1735272 RepID=UPI001B88937F|nr:piggyBac transposable element-derived protein 4-like [Gigantopelta aegis]